MTYESVNIAKAILFNSIHPGFANYQDICDFMMDDCYDNLNDLVYADRIIVREFNDIKYFAIPGTCAEHADEIKYGCDYTGEFPRQTDYVFEEAIYNYLPDVTIEKILHELQCAPCKLLEIHKIIRGMDVFELRDVLYNMTSIGLIEKRDKFYLTPKGKILANKLNVLDRLLDKVIVTNEDVD